MPSRRVVYVLEEKLGRAWLPIGSRLRLEDAKDLAAQMIQKHYRPQWEIYRIVEYTPGSRPKIRPAFKGVAKSAVMQ